MAPRKGMQTKPTKIALQRPMARHPSRCPGHGTTTDSAPGSGMPSADGRYVATTCGNRDRTAPHQGFAGLQKGGKSFGRLTGTTTNASRWPPVVSRGCGLSPSRTVLGNGLVLAVRQGDVADQCGDPSAALGPLPGIPYSCNDRPALSGPDESVCGLRRADGSELEQVARDLA